MKVYVASSWRNRFQSEVVGFLRFCGHEVYDFKNPRDGDHGFSWKQIEPDWENWTTPQYLKALGHPIAKAGFKSDMDALRWADACVLVLPSGRSAHLEAGWCAGAGKPLIIYIPEKQEPELMNLIADAITSTMDGIAASLVRAWASS
jgi:hypothetical protein